MLIIICGPTCVGKTKVGIEVAKHIKGEVVSADSQQIYKELNIGTAKPTAKERKEVPHHLIDIVKPDEQFDVAKYLELADSAIKGIVKRGRVPVVVGGAGLYLRVLCFGISHSPPRDAKFRSMLLEQRAKCGMESLYKMLQEKDPIVAKKIQPNDTTRVIRALEVIHLTGKSITFYQTGYGNQNKRYDYLKIGLHLDRAELYRRIDERVDKMVAEGLLEEANELAKKYGRTCQALNAVGYKEMNVDLIKRNSRHYAKHQLTWFKADKEIKWFRPNDLDKIFNFIDTNFVSV